VSGLLSERIRHFGERGIATPKEDMDIVSARLRVAEALAQELRNEKTSD
jgi:hypothetical protein